MRQLLANRMKELHVPGVNIAVIHEGKIEWARGFGVRSSDGPPVTADTMFQAASISKPLAAMAALRGAQALLFGVAEVRGKSGEQQNGQERNQGCSPGLIGNGGG